MVFVTHMISQKSDFKARKKCANSTIKRIIKENEKCKGKGKIKK